MPASTEHVEGRFTSQAVAQVGVTGLAVMGSNLARNFARHGHTVALHNRTQAKTDDLMRAYGDEGSFVPSRSTEEFVASLQRPRRILIMVKAGPGTDAVIDELVPLLESGDIVVDGGNAHFEDTRRREAALRERGLHFVGAGISGGEEGALSDRASCPAGHGSRTTRWGRCSRTSRPRWTASHAARIWAPTERATS